MVQEHFGSVSQLHAEAKGSAASRSHLHFDRSKQCTRLSRPVPSDAANPPPGHKVLWLGRDADDKTILAQHAARLTTVMARPDLSSSKEKETTTTTGSTTPDTMAIDYDTLPDFDAPEFNRKRPRTEPRPKQPQHPPSQSQPQHPPSQSQSQSQSSRDSLPRPTSTSQSHPNAKKKQSPRVDLNAQRAQEQAQQARQAFLYGTGPVGSEDHTS